MKSPRVTIKHILIASNGREATFRQLRVVLFSSRTIDWRMWSSKYVFCYFAPITLSMKLSFSQRKLSNNWIVLRLRGIEEIQSRYYRRPSIEDKVVNLWDKNGIAPFCWHYLEGFFSTKWNLLCKTFCLRMSALWNVPTLSGRFSFGNFMLKLY